jgi:hypothetical protein
LVFRRSVKSLRSSDGGYIKNLGKVLAAGLIVSGAGLFSANAAEKKLAVYRPVQGLSYKFGSKIAVGYYTQQDGVCALNMFLAEGAGDDAGPSAARVQFKVAPGDNVKLFSTEGEALEIKCGADAASLEVMGGSSPARYASR